MPFEWRELLNLSEILLDKISDFPDKEAVLRTAVSRAYFAAYGHAVRIAIDRYHFVALETAQDHGRLRRHFESLRMWDLARNLQELRDWRNDCDYVSEPARNIKDMAKNAVYRAQGVIILLTPRS
jgi:hypothetical protein